MLKSELMQSEKDGVEVDQGIFLAHALANAETGMHLCDAMLRLKTESIEYAQEFVMKDASISVRPRSNVTARPPW